MLVYFARSGARHPVIPAGARAADRRQRLEPRRPRPARPRHRLHRLRLVARVQPRRQLHRDRRRDPARRAARRRPPAQAGRAAPRRRRPLAARRETAVRADRPRIPPSPRPTPTQGGAAVPPPSRAMLAAAGRGTVARLCRLKKSPERCSTFPPRRRGSGSTVFLAAHLGSRAAAARAVDARRARRRARAAEELPARRRRARRASARRGAAPRRPRPARRRAIVWQDEHLAVVDKPAGLVVHPGAGRASGTLVDAARGLRRGRRARPARDRPPARPRHLGPDGRRALRGGAQAALRARPPPRARAHLPRARPRPSRPRAPGGSRRRSAATATTRPGSRSTPTRRARRSRTSSSSRRSASHALLRVRARDGPHAPDPRPPRARSTCRSSATPSTACPSPRSARQFLHASRLAFPHPFTRRARRGRLAAPARPRRRTWPRLG